MARLLLCESACVDSIKVEILSCISFQSFPPSIHLLLLQKDFGVRAGNVRVLASDLGRIGPE